MNHYGQLPAVTISFGLARGSSLGDVLTRVREVAQANLPEGVSGQFQGAAKAFQSSLSNLSLLLVVAILVVYIVLGILYESYIHPLTILSGLPSAGFGALVTLIIFRMDLNIYAFVGMIMLIGIVEKNAIMQIDFALEQEREGKSPDEAIYQGCLIRFRPIMMTTMAALLGAVPIALGYGAGGEARQPLGLVVVGGLLFSQLVTLYRRRSSTPTWRSYGAWMRPKPAANGPGSRPRIASWFLGAAANAPRSRTNGRRRWRRDSRLPFGWPDSARSAPCPCRRPAAPAGPQGRCRPVSIRSDRIIVTICLCLRCATGDVIVIMDLKFIAAALLCLHQKDLLAIVT